jgi:hypothetical protein
MSHSHSFEFWPFQDAVNTASFTTRQVLDGLPIVEVYHDHDGDWQFLCGTSLDTADLKLVCLGCMLERDATLAQLAAMPLGWCAVRDTQKDEWVLQEYKESSEDGA